MSILNIENVGARSTARCAACMLILCETCSNARTRSRLSSTRLTSCCNKVQLFRSRALVLSRAGERKAEFRVLARDLRGAHCQPTNPAS